MSDSPPPPPDPSGSSLPPPPPPAYGGVPGTPQQYVQPVGAPVAAAPAKDGKLIAAGVLSFISGGVVGLIGLWLFSVTQSDTTAWIDDLSGGAITFMALFFLAAAGLYIATGVGCVMGRHWGRITAIVVNVILIVLTLIGMVGGGDAAGGIVPLAWCGTILGLAWAGQPSS